MQGELPCRSSSSWYRAKMMEAYQTELAEEEEYVDNCHGTEKNLKKYLLMAATEDVFVTRNGKVVAKLSNPYQSRIEVPNC